MSHELGLELEADLFPSGTNHVPTTSPVEEFFFEQNYGAARTDDTLYRKRFERGTSAKAPAPLTKTEDPPPLRKNFAFDPSADSPALRKYLEGCTPEERDEIIKSAEQHNPKVAEHFRHVIATL